MAEEIVIVGTDMQRVMELAVAFHGLDCAITAAESARPIKTAARIAPRARRASIIWLTGKEEAGDVRSFLAGRSGSPTLFLAPAMPPSAALARAIRSSDADIVSASEAGIVIVATLIAMHRAIGGTEAAGPPAP